MNEQNINGLALMQPSVGSNPMDQGFDIGNGALANTDIADMVEPLYASKAKQLAEASKAKEIAIAGIPKTDPNIVQQTLDEVLYGPTDGNQETSDGFGRQFGSGVQSLLADTADLITTGGAYANQAISDATGLDYYSKEDFNNATNFFDKYSGKNADAIWGYDRTRLNAQQADVMTSIDKGDYGNAAIAALKASPGTIVDSLPVMLSFFIGVGEVKAVQVAGETALKVAKASGLTAKATKQAIAASQKVARKQLALHTKLMNVARTNAGLINYANVQTQQQLEQLKAKGGEITAGVAARVWATNIFMNALDKMAFKDIVKFKSAPVSKELWGKLDKASKFGVAKQIVKTIGAGAKNMTEEGLQEYVQTWGEIVNANWGAPDTQNFLDSFSKGNNLQALTAMFLGAGSGLTMGVPSQLNGLRKGLNTEGQLKKAYNNPKKNIDVGFANSNDQQAQIDKLDTDYNTAKDTFDNLTNIEDAASRINSNKDQTALDKVVDTQKALHGESQATDSGANQLVTQFGNDEVQSLLTSIGKDTTLTEALDEKTIQDIVNSPGMQGVQKIGAFLAAHPDKLTPEIKTAYNEAQKGLQEQATAIVNSGGTEVSYKNAKTQLNHIGSVTKSTSDYAKTKAKPLSAKSSAKNIGQTKQSKPTNFVKRILGTAKPSEAETEMSKYDNGTLDEIIKESNKAINAAVKKQKTILSDPNLSKAGRLRAQMSKLPEQTKAEQLVATAKRIKNMRKKVKKTYSPDKTLKETIIEFAKDKLKNLKDAADRIKAEKQSKPQDPATDKNRATKEDKQTIKTAQKMVADVRGNLDSINIDDVPIIEEAISILVDSGNFGKKFADKLLLDIKDKFDEANIKDVDPKEVRKAFVNTGKTILSDAKTTTRADIKLALGKLGKLVDSKMTLNERVFVAKLFGKAVKMGSLTKDEVKPYLDKLPDNLKFDKTDFTKDKFTAFIKKTYEAAVEAVKTNTTSEGRQQTEETVKSKVKEKVGNMQESGLGKELTKDFNTIIANLVAAKSKSSKELKKQFKKFKKDYGSNSSLEIYQSVKEMFNDLIDGKETEVVTEIPGTDINTDKGC